MQRNTTSSPCNGQIRLWVTTRRKYLIVQVEIDLSRKMKISGIASILYKENAYVYDHSPSMYIMIILHVTAPEKS